MCSSAKTARNKRRPALRLADLPPVPLLNRPQGFPDGWVLPSQLDRLRALRSRVRGLVAQHHTALHTVAEPIPRMDIPHGRVEEVARDLAQTLFAERKDGRGIVGLAAPQKGIKASIIVADLSTKYPELEFMGLSALVDAEIVEEGGDSETRMESCFSCGGNVAPVTTSKYAVVRCHTIRGELVEKEFFDYDVRILRHETDHPKAILAGDRSLQQGYELNWTYAEHESLSIAHHRAALQPEGGLDMGTLERWPPHYPREQFLAYSTGSLVLLRDF